MTSKISDSERCVDELLGNLPRLNELIATFEEGIEVPSDTIEESKKIASEITKFIEENHLTHQIPPYVVEKVQNSVFKLQKLISDKDLSKFKFCFKQATNKSSPPQLTQTKPSSQDVKVKAGTTDTSEIGLGGTRIENKTGENIVLRGVALKQDVTLINLKDCSVSIVGHAEMIYIKGLKNSTVTICLAERAVTVRHCQDCRFRIMCQQLRIEETCSSLFQIYVKTRAMLESSKGLQFEPIHIDELSAELSKESDRLLEQMMDRSDFKVNNWRCIDDFDWLSPDCPSKNYVIIE